MLNSKHIDLDIINVKLLGEFIALQIDYPITY